MVVDLKILNFPLVDSAIRRKMVFLRPKIFIYERVWNERSQIKDITYLIHNHNTNYFRVCFLGNF